MSRNQRFKELRKVPAFAAVDHRFFLDANGNDSRLSHLPRNERRRIKAEGIKVGKKYKQIMKEIRHSGIGYPVDQILRDLAIEYTNRYASSGIMNQPTSFNYFESFCDIKLIENSTAPYTYPLPEIDHLFSVADYFDFITSNDAPKFHISNLNSIPESKIYHFTQNGNINDFTYMTAEGREFVISGFSMVRRGSSLHWYVLGGEILSEAEWQGRCDNDAEVNVEDAPLEKRPFLSKIIQEQGNKAGPPVALQGTKSAVRTIIAGETDIESSKHAARCYMSETENSFVLFCDDPDIFYSTMEKSKVEDLISHMRSKVESAAVMWNLAEGFFQLPLYFQFRFTISRDLIEASNKPKPKSVKGGRGIGAHFRHVNSIEISDTKPSVIRSYTPPDFDVETEGYWRRLSPESHGRDRNGNPIQGRTWVKSTNKWRERPSAPRTVYIKSSVASAKIQISEYIESASRANSDASQEDKKCGVLYVMRCLAMREEVYKVGWTSDSAEQRAKDLSSATGVPVSFVVVATWKHPDPEALEKGVHAMLNPYRLNEAREFFMLNYSDLEAIITAEISRSTPSVPPA